MDRREFLSKATAGLAAAAITLGPAAKFNKLFAKDVAKWPDLVAVRGENIKNAFDKGIEALGGIESFVRKNQTVLVKPNMGWAVAPDKAANTNPELIKRIIEHCLKAGAKKVYVFDHTCDQWESAYKTSMLEETAKNAGALVANGHRESDYQETKITSGTLKNAKIHELYLSSDVIINVPVLKHHSGAGMTCAMKNLMGVVWDRGAYHRQNLDACIADFCTYKRPTLNVIDAYKVMTSGGPRGSGFSEYINPKTIILTTDIVAADAASAKTLGSEPARYSYIEKAARHGFGTNDLDSLKIQRISL